MWEVPRYRIKAYLRQIRRGRGASLGDHGPSFHFKRTRGELMITEGVAYQSDIIPISVVLNDFNALGVLVFSSKPLIPGQSVNLTMEHPKQFFIKGTVVSSTRVLRTQAVISPTSSYPHRVYIRFNVRTLQELVEIRKYCHEINTKHLQTA